MRRLSNRDQCAAGLSYAAACLQDEALRVADGRSVLHYQRINSTRHRPSKRQKASSGDSHESESQQVYSRRIRQECARGQQDHRRRGALMRITEARLTMRRTAAKRALRGRRSFAMVLKDNRCSVEINVQEPASGRLTSASRPARARCYTRFASIHSPRLDST